MLDLDFHQVGEKVQHGTHDFFHGFRMFLFKQNIIALALAVVIGNATNNVVQALIRDMFMPVVNVVVRDQSWVTWGKKIGTLNVANLDPNGNPIYVDDAGGVIPLKADGTPTKKGHVQTHEVPNRLLYGDIIWQFTNLLLIGFMAFLITQYVMRPAPAPPPPPPAPPGPPMRGCPFCLESVQAAAKVCKFCTRDLPAVVDEATVPK